MSKTLRERVMDEADLCRNDGADDIARLLDEVAAALADQAQAEPDRRLELAMQNYERWKAHAIKLSARLQQYEPGAGMALSQPAAQPVAVPETLRLDRALAFVPDGYALVPVEPTPEMLDAAFAFESQGSGIQGGDLEDVYGAMLSAAPKVQQ